MQKFNDKHYSLFPQVELPHHQCFFIFLSTATGGAGTGCGLGGPGVHIPQATGDFSVFHYVQTGSAAHAASSSMGTVILIYIAWF
jgi:hypothetical protein